MSYQIIISLVLSMVGLLQVQTWHIYSSIEEKRTLSPSCQMHNKYDNTNIPTFVEKVKLWPGLMTGSSTLYGLEEALTAIYENQHPLVCEDAKFIVSLGYPWGFGSAIHVEASIFSIAIELGRVFIQNPLGPPKTYIHDNTWQVNNSFCKNQGLKTLECYYEPWSSCNISHATRNLKWNKSKQFKIKDVDIQLEKDRNNRTILSPNFLKKVENMKYIIIEHTGLAQSSKFIPSKLKNLIECLPIREHLHYYWWRAITTTYVLRPNPTFLKHLQTFHTLNLSPKEHCIGIYVRHGDKNLEMKLLPTESYLQVAYDMWNKGLVTSQYRNRNGTIFIGSEDSQVIQDAESWGKRHGWTILFTNLFNRSDVTASLDWYSKRSHRRHKKSDIHHDLEYISMILNLEYALRCDAWVCTLASNWCRIIDELRATVAGKHANAFADISVETCASPPCIGSNITDFGWR